jgi:hypothetical protein
MVYMFVHGQYVVVAEVVGVSVQTIVDVATVKYGAWSMMVLKIRFALRVIGLGSSAAAIWIGAQQ